MSTPGSLTSAMLSVQAGVSRGYASEDESEAGAVGPAPHQPDARSSATFRGALASLGVVPASNRSAAAGRESLRTSAGVGSALRQSAPLYGSDFARLNPFQQHQRLAAEYVRYYGGDRAAQSRRPTPTVTDADVLRSSYRFVRSASDDAAAAGGNDEQRMAKRYYDRLFREYALADLSQYRTGRVGLRWRTESEVLAGRGQFSCGNKVCTRTDGLKSFELNFAYEECGEVKQALVKVRACSDCAYRLHYRQVKSLAAADKSRRREERRVRKEERRASKKKKKKSSSEAKKKSKKKKEKSSKRRRSSDESDTSSSDSSDDSDAADEESASSRKRPRLEVSSSAPRDGGASDATLQDNSAVPPRATAPSHAAHSPPSPPSPSLPAAPSDDRATDFLQRFFPHMFP